MNLFDKYLKEGYEYEVIKAEVDEVSGVLELYIKSNFVMPFDEIRNIKAGFIENIGEIHDVEFKFEFYDVKVRTREPGGPGGGAVPASRPRRSSRMVGRRLACRDIRHRGQEQGPGGQGF